MSKDELFSLIPRVPGIGRTKLVSGKHQNKKPEELRHELLELQRSSASGSDNAVLSEASGFADAVSSFASSSSSNDPREPLTSGELLRVDIKALDKEQLRALIPRVPGIAHTKIADGTHKPKNKGELQQELLFEGS